MPRVITIDTAASFLAESSAIIDNDGASSSTITVTVLNTDGNPVPGRTVTLVINSGTGTLTQPATVTDAAGQTSGSVVSSTLGTIVIGATVLGVTLADTVSILVDGDFALPAANKYINGLESASKTTDDPNGINVDGFAWVSSNGIPFSIVRSDGYVVWSAGNPGGAILSGPFPANEWENAPDGTDGTHAFRARYPGSFNSQFAEQRFNLGADYPDLWIRYWIRVPINFIHNDSNPSNNNKWLSLWQNTYDDTFTRTWEYWPDGADGSEISWHVGGGGHVNYEPFITYPTDQGRWMQVVHHLKVSSAPDVADGVLQMYRRWSDESGWTTIHDRTDIVINLDTGRTGFRNGFILGASNSDWADVTEWLIDRFEVSTTSLI